MGYVTNNLMRDEQVIYEGKIHWFIFVPGAVFFFVAIWVFNAMSGTVGGAIVASIAMLLSLSSLANAFIFKISTELAVTTKRVIAKTGFISRKTIELNHSKVESFNVDQSVFGRIFGFGTIVVCGTGGNRTPIPNIDNPLEFRRQAMNVVDEVGQVAGAQA